MVRKKAEEVLKDIINENMTDAEKVHAVFKWICDNTYYDWEGWESWGKEFLLRLN